MIIDSDSERPLIGTQQGDDMSMLKSAFRGLSLSKRGAPPEFPRSGSIGEDEDGNLFYAAYEDYSGEATWKPLPRWRWLTRRRVYQDLQYGDDWYIYQLEKA